MNGLSMSVMGTCLTPLFINKKHSICQKENILIPRSIFNFEEAIIRNTITE